MTTKPTAFFYSITLILSAFLLFSVQPMFTRMILPMLGGAPAVWNTAMVFFQAMLLAGYAYAHGTSRFLSIKAQAVLHMVLLFACAALLPIILPTGLQPPTSSNPAFWQLGVMAMVVGAPFFIVSASAPMFQRWFSGTDHPDAANPYFLYAASNIGSMAALLSYPVIVETTMTLHMQSMAWAGGYGILIALTMLCALMVWKNGGQAPARMAASSSHKPTSREKMVWLGLAFVPSSLLLGVTTYITTDLASVPLLWILPLTLYLSTFIIVFARKPIVTTQQTIALFTAFSIFTIFMISAGVFEKKALLFITHLLVFFFACLMCHKKLADLRPAASDLTGFYMYMSAGGVLGGMFNALLAPIIFPLAIEYALVLCVVLFIRAYAMGSNFKIIMPKVNSIALWLVVAAVILSPVAWHYNMKSFYIGAAVLVAMAMIAMRAKPLAFAAFGSLALLIYSPMHLNGPTNTLLTERNFFGVIRVVDHDKGTRNFLHGTTLHGSQPKDEKYRLMPISYYNPLGSIGDVFAVLDKKPTPQTIGVLGLGVGTLACYGLEGRNFDFYEIDPAVVRIAEDKSLFTYLSDCGSPYKTFLGDGRLALKDKPDASYDALFLDAFSSDNIPMHLLTLEAFETYMQKVKAGGMIVFNISNRFLDLEPQLAALSVATKVPAVIRYSRGGPIAKDSNVRFTTSIYVVFTPNPDTLIALRKKAGWRPVETKPGTKVWTDDFANIVSSLILFN